MIPVALTWKWYWLQSQDGCCENVWHWCIQDGTQNEADWSKDSASHAKDGEEWGWIYGIDPKKQ